MNILNSIFVLVNLAHFVFTDEYPCDVTVSVDISDGVLNQLDQSISKDGVTYPQEQYFEYDGKVMGCFCNLKPCIKKCCPEGQYMTSDKKCAETVKDFREDLVKLTSNDLTTYSIINVPCNGRSLILNPQEEDEKLVIDEKGFLVWGEAVTENDDEVDKEESYCVDYIEDTDDVKILMCNLDGVEAESNTHNSIGIFNCFVLNFVQLSGALWNFKYF